MAKKYRGVLARYNIVSFRVTDAEYLLLKDLSGGQSVSATARQFLADYISHLKGEFPR